MNEQETNEQESTVTYFDKALSFHCGFANDRYSLPNNITTVFTNKYNLKNYVPERSKVTFYYIDTLQRSSVVTKQTTS